MIKKLFSLCSIFLTFNFIIVAYGEIKTTRLRDGSYYEISYENGKRNGRAFFYDSKGRIREAATYKDNLLDGLKVKFYLSGAMKENRKYVNGKFERVSTFYNKREQKTSIINYHDNNEIFSVRNFQDARFNFNFNLEKYCFKICVFWDRIAQSHTQNAQYVIEDLKFFGEKSNQKLISYYENRRIYCRCGFNKEGLASDNCLIYYPSAKVMAHDTYVNGKLSGGSRVYYLSGALLADYKYKNGLPNGNFVIYDMNGKIKMNAQYKNGLLDGETNVFYRDKTCCLKAEFSKGKLINKLKYYFPFSNQIEYLVEFSDGKIVKSRTFSEEGEETFSASY
jgi:antitoxin component YwqK of YwqJK toxin-antitoxin module